MDAGRQKYNAIDHVRLCYELKKKKEKRDEKKIHVHMLEKKLRKKRKEKRREASIRKKFIR